MAIVIRCECGKEFETGDENAGRRGRCPACQRELIVPQPKPHADSDFAPVHEFPPQAMSGKAVASFVLGLCSVVMCCLTGVPAVIFGILGLSDINNPKKNVAGKGFAITGIVLGSLWSLLFVPAVLIALLLPAVQSGEAARRAQCTNNLKQIALALHNYESVYGSLPPAAIYDATGKPLLSWRVLILPYLEQNPLYAQFHLDEPWDSPHNQPLSETTLRVFQCPSADLGPSPLTGYQVIVDPRSMFTGKPEGVSLRQVTDGTANTLLVVEASQPVSWSKPQDLVLDPLAGPTFGTGSKHPGGFDAVFADGSVRFIRSSPGNPLSLQNLQGLVTRNGGEIVNVP